MGYHTRFKGEITIIPPIPWGDVKDSPFLPERARSWSNGDDPARRDVMLRVDHTDTTTDQGVLNVRHAVAVTSSEDESRGYDIVEHLQWVVDAYPDHQFTGRIQCEGEEAGDLWRLEVHDRKAVRVEPRIVWPDGTEGL